VAADRGQDVHLDARQDRIHVESAVRMNRARVLKPSSVSLAEDAIPTDQCPRCGLRQWDGRHRIAGECIVALRSVIADLR